MTNDLTMMLLILFGTAGLNMILVRSVLFYRYRAWMLQRFPSTESKPLSLGYLVNCPQCHGMWFGMLFGGALLLLWGLLPLWLQGAAVIPLCGGCVSLISYAADRQGA
jgi:hypothetical protein